MNTVRAAAVRVMSPDTEVGVWKNSYHDIEVAA